MKSRSGTKFLAQLIGAEFSGLDVQLGGVALSASEVEAGDLFVAIAGARHHGLDFVQEAITRGAVAVLSDRKLDVGIPFMIHPDPKAVLGQVCNAVLGPVDLQLFGVTGTNGKTSVTSYVRELLVNLGVKTAL